MLGVDTEDVRVVVRRAHGPTAEGDQLITRSDACVPGRRTFHDLIEDDASVTIGGDGGLRRSMSHQQPGSQSGDESANLVDRNRVAQSNVEATALPPDGPLPVRRNAPVDADDSSRFVKQRPTRIARIDGRVGLDAVGV